MSNPTDNIFITVMDTDSDKEWGLWLRYRLNEDDLIKLDGKTYVVTGVFIEVDLPNATKMMATVMPM